MLCYISFDANKMVKLKSSVSFKICIFVQAEDIDQYQGHLKSFFTNSSALMSRARYKAFT